MRQAKSYLKELTTGRAENRDFDWVREIERNPEIQARVFDWAMALASTPNNEIPAAGKQLLALGTIALPVVERVLEASRDPVHRQSLALIAVRSGKIERLAVLVDPSVPARLVHRWIREGVMDLCAELESAPPEERKAALGVLAQARKGPRIDPVRAALEIAAGDSSGFPEKLLAIEQCLLFGSTSLHDLLDRVPEAADAFAARALDKTAPLDSRLRYLEALAAKDPAKLTREHWAILEEAATLAVEQSSTREQTRQLVDLLVRLGKLDVLQQLAAGNAGRYMVERFQKDFAETKKLGEAPGIWGAILRRTLRENPTAYALLRSLADVNDEAATEHTAFLRVRSVEAPTVKLEAPKREPSWTPSPKYVELMIGLLDLNDEEVLGLALGVLERASQGLGPESLPALERLFGSSVSENNGVPAASFRVILRMLELRPDAGPAVAELCRKTPGEARNYALASLGRAPIAVRRSLFQSALALDVGAEDGSWLNLLLRALPTEDRSKLLLERLASFDTTKKRAALIEMEGVSDLVSIPAGSSFLKGAALDTSLAVGYRVIAAQSAGEVSMEWLDWAQLVKTEDPLVEGVSHDWLRPWLEKRPQQEQDLFLETLGKSKKPRLRQLRLLIYPLRRPERVDVLLKALDDPSEEVQEEAAGVLLADSKFRPETLEKLLKNPVVASRNHKLYEIVASNGDSRLLEPLVQLLDDHDPEVRKLALGALSSIRKELEQKKEWQTILQAAKERRKE